MDDRDLAERRCDVVGSGSGWERVVMVVGNAGEEQGEGGKRQAGKRTKCSGRREEEPGDGKVSAMGGNGARRGWSGPKRGGARGKYVWWKNEWRRQNEEDVGEERADVVDGGRD
ncbi:hypothetical protein Tco_1455641 [Tanacetum coccineum]